LRLAKGKNRKLMNKDLKEENEVFGGKKMSRILFEKGFQ